MADKELRVRALLEPAAVASFHQDSQRSEFNLYSARGGVLILQM